MRLLFYQPIELPEYCYLSEAVEFIALGRAPIKAEASHPPKDEDGNYILGLDSRFDWREMPDNFEPAGYYVRTEYDEAEFSFAGFEMPPDYLSISDSYHGGEIGNALGLIASFSRLLIEDWDEEFVATLKEAQAKAQEVICRNKEAIDLFNQANSKFDKLYELAWAKLFQQIHSGAVAVEAIDRVFWQNCADRNEYEAGANFVEIPSEAFSIGHEFDQNSVHYNGREFVCARTRVAPLVDIISSSLSALSSAHTSVYGATLVQATEVSRKVKRRGAPYAVDWSIVSDYLVQMRQAEGLPDKKEARVQLAIDFCKRRFGRRVGRSTVQRRLENILDANIS